MRHRLAEHLLLVNGGHPVGVGGGVVVAAAVAVALDEGATPEVSETGARGGQALTRAISSGVRVLK